MDMKSMAMTVEPNAGFIEELSLIFIACINRAAINKINDIGNQSDWNGAIQNTRTHSG
jgi:hypothetical protein